MASFAAFASTRMAAKRSSRLPDTVGEAPAGRRDRTRRPGFERYTRSRFVRVTGRPFDLPALVA